MNPRAKKQISVSEKQIITTMYSLLLGNSSTSGKNKGWMHKLSFAFGVNKNVITAIYDKRITQDFTHDRKERSDKEETVFNSDKKQKQVFQL